MKIVEFGTHRQVVVEISEGREVTALIRTGETPRQALNRLRRHWRQQALFAASVEDQYDEALEQLDD